MRDLSADEQDFIAAMGSPLVCAKGDAIIEEGAAADAFYFLLEGEVAVRKGAREVARLEHGVVFGEMALFNDNVRTSSVHALSAVRLLAISSSTFARHVLHHAPAAVQLMEALGRVMVQRLAQRDADLLSRIARDDPEFADVIEAFAALKGRLLTDWALKYHAMGRPGKLAITATKSSGTAADLSVAYSPGVAQPCLAIRDNPELAYEYTTRANLVGVITNGTAVLGLGDIGALAAKPVMESKAVLFKRFADVDAFDLEIDEHDTDRFVDMVCKLSPTFGGINLEDIAAPACFEIERRCQAALDIPVFHDDQHGTAIIAGAGLLNALRLVDKGLDEIRVVFSGAGAAGFATARFFITLGVPREHLVMTDIQGVVYRGRGDNNYLDEIAADTEARTLGEAIRGADVFVGVSVGNVLSAQMLASMARDPIVFALANPTPEIDPGLAHRTRPDVIMATGRSDLPNQINNVIAFPYLFRGALEVRATEINDAMKIAAARAIGSLTHEPIDPTTAGFSAPDLVFDRKYIIPKPFDQRLLPRVATTVARAAVESGAARRDVDLDSVSERLSRLARTLAS